jgi:hypothetical protein
LKALSGGRRAELIIRFPSIAGEYYFLTSETSRIFGETNESKRQRIS